MTIAVSLGAKKKMSQHNCGAVWSKSKLTFGYVKKKKALKIYIVL